MKQGAKVEKGLNIFSDTSLLVIPGRGRNSQNILPTDGTGHKNCKKFQKDKDMLGLKFKNIS